MENDEQKLESIKALFDILLADAEAKVAIVTVAKENGIVLPPKAEYVALNLTLASARLGSSDGEVRHPRRMD